jgi:hypothetical protein
MVIFLGINFKKILPLKFKGKNTVILGLVLFFLIIGNVGIYGYNLMAYGSLLPSCTAILSEEQCDLRRVYFEKRGPTYVASFDQGKAYQLTVPESIELGHPGPIRYFFVYWLPNLFSRLNGVCGVRSYYSIKLTQAHVLFFYWMILVALIYYRDYSFKVTGLLGILVFYSAILFLNIYDYDLVHRFNLGLLQGRYLFPVINIAYVLASKILMDIPRKPIQISALIFMFGLYLWSGPLTFIIKYSSVFYDWLII